MFVSIKIAFLSVVILLLYDASVFQLTLAFQSSWNNIVDFQPILIPLWEHGFTWLFCHPHILLCITFHIKFLNILNISMLWLNVQNVFLHVTCKTGKKGQSLDGLGVAFQVLMPEDSGSNPIIFRVACRFSSATHVCSSDSLPHNLLNSNSTLFKNQALWNRKRTELSFYNCK